MSGYDINIETPGGVGALSIAGVPIESGVPNDDDILQYRSSTDRWTYAAPATITGPTGPTGPTFPTVRFVVSTEVNFPVLQSEIPFQTDLVVLGTDIARISATRFEIQPGLYSITFDVGSRRCRYRSTAWVEPNWSLGLTSTRVSSLLASIQLTQRPVPLASSRTWKSLYRRKCM